MTNFDFLQNDIRFESFAKSAVTSELLLHIDRQACVLSCRRTAECAVKWIYSADGDLKKPKDDTLIKLINNRVFKKIIGGDIYRRIDFIRRMGNTAAHSTGGISQKQAELCLENLFVFLDFVAYCYSDSYTQKEFDPALLSLTTEEALSFVTEKTIDIEKLISQNLSQKQRLTQNRVSHRDSYISKPMFSGNDNKKLYVFSMLDDCMWELDKNLKADVLLNDGFVADFVLYGKNQVPIGIVLTAGQGKNTKQKARNAANALAKKYNITPALFCSNGFVSYMDKGKTQAKKITKFYTPKELWSVVNNR